MNKNTKKEIENKRSNGSEESNKRNEDIIGKKDNCNQNIIINNNDGNKGNLEKANSDNPYENFYGENSSSLDLCISNTSKEIIHTNNGEKKSTIGNLSSIKSNSGNGNTIHISIEEKSQNNPNDNGK